MQIEWTEKELDDLVTRLGKAPADAPRSRASVKAVATRAVELWQARQPSGQVAELVSAAKAVVWADDEVPPLMVEQADAALSRLASLAQRAEAAEKELAAIRERAENKIEAGHRLRMALLAEPNRAWSAAKYEDRALELTRWVLAGDAPNDSMQSTGSGTGPKEREKSAAVQLVELAVEAGLPVRFAPKPYRCSDTCTHDDAANPGHPERVRERSKAFNEAAWRAANPEADDYSVALVRGREEGAEAMRAACWEAIQPLLDEVGLGPQEKARWKAAIEGAAP